jgi:hypothetical protein
MKQGQSLTTIDKERRLGAMFDMQCRLYQCKPQVLGKHPAFHIDLNAGCGHNHEFNVPGSPIVYIEVMRSRYPQIPWKAWFIDRNLAHAEELRERICKRYGDLPNVTVLCQDNEEALVSIGGKIPEFATGTVLADPNGWLSRRKDNGDGVPLKELRFFFSKHRRIDILMNLNARLYRLTANDKEKYETFSVSEFHWLLGKSHWLITSEVSNGHSSFVCLTGRNMETGDYKSYGWYRLNSQMGQAICERLELRARQRSTGQGNLLLEVEQ